MISSGKEGRREPSFGGFHFLSVPPFNEIRSCKLVSDVLFDASGRLFRVSSPKCSEGPLFGKGEIPFLMGYTCFATCNNVHVVLILSAQNDPVAITSRRHHALRHSNGEPMMVTLILASLDLCFKLVTIRPDNCVMTKRLVPFGGIALGAGLVAVAAATTGILPVEWFR